MALKGEWALSGGTWTDSSGAGHDLTATGTVSQQTGFTGAANTCANVATTACLGVADHADFSGLGAFSFCCRIYVTNISANRHVYSKGVAASSNLESLLLVTATSGALSFRCSSDGSTNSAIANGPSNVSANTWYTVVCVYDGSYLRVYKDNMVTSGTAVAFSGNTHNGAADFRLGSDGSASPANGLYGRFDDVRWYDHALSQSEREAYAALGNNFAPPPSTFAIAFTPAAATVAMTAEVAFSEVVVGFTPAAATVSLSAARYATALISFTPAAATVAISGEIPSVFLVGFTPAAATVAMAVEQHISTVVVGFTPAAATVAISGELSETLTIGFTPAAAAVLITAFTVVQVLEPFTIKVRHKTTREPITGLTTVFIAFSNPETDELFDFVSKDFASTGTFQLALNEVDATNQPGVYRKLIETTHLSGWVEFEGTYDDGEYIYTYPSEAFYVAGVRVTGAGLTTAQEALLSATATAAQVAVLPTAAEIRAEIDANSTRLAAIDLATDTLEASVAALPAQIATEVDALTVGKFLALK